jgi:hypothetical protein
MGLLNVPVVPACVQEEQRRLCVPEALAGTLPSDQPLNPLLDWALRTTDRTASIQPARLTTIGNAEANKGKLLSSI